MNTLAHIGIQGITARAISPGADVKWVFLGCIVSDVPWILQRALGRLALSIDPYELRLYAIAQSSLAVSLVLCGALALLSSARRRIFAVLSLNTLFHLFLDALQKKAASGVHLLAPFSWELLNFGLFWPESWPTYLLTATGIGFLAYSFRRPGNSSGLVLGACRLAGAGTLFAAYVLLPVALLAGPEAANNHFVDTLRSHVSRPGRVVEFDRAYYLNQEHGGLIQTFAGEELRVEGISPAQPGLVSLRGRFANEKTVRVDEVHYHSRWFRDLASYVGLGFVALWWIGILWRELCRSEHSPPTRKT
jgi:hypothetical protein